MEKVCAKSGRVVWCGISPEEVSRKRNKQSQLVCISLRRCITTNSVCQEWTYVCVYYTHTQNILRQRSFSYLIFVLAVE